MKATIRYTKLKSFRRLEYHAGQSELATKLGSDEPEDDAIVRVAEITHCTPIGRRIETGSLIHLTNGKTITTATHLDELERRIDAAEATDANPAE